MAQAMIPGGRRPTNGVYQRVLDRISMNADPLGPTSVWSRATVGLRRVRRHTPHEDGVRVWLTTYGWLTRKTGAHKRKRLSHYPELLALALSSVFIFLGMRILFRLMGANPLATMVAGVYHITDVLMAPFLGLSALPRVGMGVLDVPALVAMIFYALLALLLTLLLRVLTNTLRVKQRV